MLKKCTSWLLLVSLLSACFLIFPVSAVPADDAEAAEQGYHAKYETADGTKYFAFEALSPTNRNSLPADVPAGGTVTLIANVTIGFELILDRDLTLDGNGHTLDGAFRTDDSVTGADVTVKNLNVVLDLTTERRTRNAYLYQINAGNACTFENCTFTVNGNPKYGLIILRGNLTMRDCTFTWTADGNKPVFFDDANGQAVLEGTEFDLSGAPNATLGISTGYVAEVNGQGYNSFSSAMAAAALCYLKGGTPAACAAAAAMALGNLLGLVCDPVAGLVEVPCVKRNVVGAVNAVACANMALAGIDSAIPCDEVIDAMGRVGLQLSPDLRETGLGGLAATPTGRAIARRLAAEAGGV